MRLHFQITPNIQIVPFDYQHFLIGAFHKWSGWNKSHDETSLYSLGWLQGAKLTKNGFDFPKGASWFISLWEDHNMKQLIKGIMDEPDICCGMKIEEIQMQDTPAFGCKEVFKVATPVFIRKYNQNGKTTHLTFQDKEADYYLTETLNQKMKIAGLDYNVNVSFDKTYNSPKTKLVRINKIKNKANFCPVIIEGDPEAIKFAWNVGIGHSTGCGFGAIY